MNLKFPFFGRNRLKSPPPEDNGSSVFSEKELRQVLSSGELTSEFAVRRFWRSMSALSVMPNPDEILRTEHQSIATYRRMSDGHLGAVTRKRRSAVRARPWRIEGMDVPGDVLETINRAFKSLGIQSATSKLWSANLFGYSVLEVIWQQVGGLILPVELKDKPQEWFGWNADGTFRFVDDSGIGQIVPPRKFLVSRSEATYENPYGKPLLSECFWPLAFKRGGLKFWMTFLEHYGMPRGVAKVPAGSSAEEREQLLMQMMAMVQDACIVLNDNQSLEIQEASGKASSTDAYAQLIRWADTEISKSILGETLTTELPNQGSMAAAEVHNDVRKDLALDDACMIEESYNLLIRWICELNWPGLQNIPVFSIDLPEDLKAARVERDQKLIEIGARFTPQYISDTYGIDIKYLQNSGVPAPEFAEETEAPFASGVADNLRGILSSVAPSSMQGQMEELINPIIEMAGKHASYAEFETALEETFPGLPFGKFQDAMEKCLLLSEMRGRIDA